MFQTTHVTMLEICSVSTVDQIHIGGCARHVFLYNCEIGMLCYFVNSVFMGQMNLHGKPFDYIAVELRIFFSKCIRVNLFYQTTFTNKSVLLFETSLGSTPATIIL